ncbi:MAG: hypothetical protein JEZ09_06460 [Salinivirgaceae bacterium]|nr:hypothetical protein [Salinivirgaceae bacterium]
MKKLVLSLMAFIMTIMVYAQPVADNAIIPVSVTLNSILRLNVTSGGNIEFQVNTLEQYTNGITNSDRYDTRFTVASSIDFDVLLYAEDATLIGSDLASGLSTMALNFVGYEILSDGTGVDATEWDLPAGYQGLINLPANAQAEAVEGIASAAAGDIDQNAFIINWALADAAVQGGTGGNANTLLSANLGSDRYSTNVFLVLKAAD